MFCTWKNDSKAAGDLPVFMSEVDLVQSVWNCSLHFPSFFEKKTQAKLGVIQA